MALFNSGKSKYSTIKINVSSRKRDIPEGLWIKCRKCMRTLYKKALEKNDNVCPHCNYHSPLTAWKRIELLTDAGSFQEIYAQLSSVDPLEFVDSEKYLDRLHKNKVKTGLNEGIVCGTATLDGRKYALGVMDFRFLGASMGSAVGEKITRLLEKALKEKISVQAVFNL